MANETTERAIQKAADLTCSSCGGPDFYACGCYDRCHCGHDRRSHIEYEWTCSHVGCDCRMFGCAARAKDFR